MLQNDDNDKAYISRNNAQDDKQIEDMEDWRNEHGQPDNEFLQSLAEDGGVEAIEKLKSIAMDLDVSIGPNASVDEIIGGIRSATQNDPNATT